MWEYRMETFAGFLMPIKTDKVQAQMNVLGAEGWELVAATSYGSSVLMYFKRFKK